MSSNRALIVWGGWDGHTPKACAELFAPWLESRGFEVEVSDSLDAYLDAAAMAALDLVVPIWTMGQITDQQEQGLLNAVSAGVGIAGWHGGMCDSFRNNVNYQWMTGGQWVAHPGGCIEAYKVEFTNRDHPVTRGLDDFVLRDTEQYYLHVDPSNNVLATTTVDIGDGVAMPAVWTRMWGEGRVFYASFGHTDRDFEVPEAREVVQRGMLWASRGLD